jgi:hypothetical protein
MTEVKNQTQIATPFTIININQQNEFTYVVAKPRRAKHGIQCEAAFCQQPSTAITKLKDKRTLYMCSQHVEQYKEIIWLAVLAFNRF